MSIYHPEWDDGTTSCPVEGVPAEIDEDGDCSACGVKVVTVSD